MSPQEPFPTPPEETLAAPGDSFQPPPPAPEERYPFWGWSDVFLFAGLALPCMLAGVLVVKAVFLLLRVPAQPRAYELLPSQFLGYGLMFGVLYTILKLHYGRPVWKSLGWIDPRMPAIRPILAGVLVAFAVVLASAFLRTPDADTPMKELLSDRTSMLLIALFGTTLGPLCEELAFRGFLQPLLVRSLGAVAGILVCAVPFGLLHLQQYGNSWRHALLITGAGAAFGWMRHATGSTRAATIMHASYNALFFFALFAQRKDLPHSW